MNLNPAKEFLTRCFTQDDTIALLLRSEEPAKVTQRIVTMERAIAPRYFAWLAYENAHGANVYIAANPLRPGSRKRTKESIATVRHLYIDIDTDGDARVAALQASDGVPAPTAILSTSPGKYQVLWRVDGFDFERQEEMLKVLAIYFGGDPACTDRNRVLRIPGLLNCKYSLSHRVTVEYPTDSIWSPSDFRLHISAAGGMLLDRTITSRKQPANLSNSESDWAWVSHELARGGDPVKLTQELAARRSDKPDPHHYAQRTVDVASARIWVVEGIPQKDIITMLESRRRFEMSANLCFSRAREIAMTAQRMIARKMSA
jgi:hypothetical protein